MFTADGRLGRDASSPASLCLDSSPHRRVIISAWTVSTQLQPFQVSVDMTQLHPHLPDALRRLIYT